VRGLERCLDPPLTNTLLDFPYLSTTQIQDRVWEEGAWFENYHNLMVPDILWSATMMGDIHLSLGIEREESQCDFLLEDLLDIGLYELRLSFTGVPGRSDPSGYGIIHVCSL